MVRFPLLILIFTPYILAGKPSTSCFEDMVDYYGSKVTTTDQNFIITNYQAILRCAKVTSEETTYGAFHFASKSIKCIWLQNLEICIRQWKEIDIDCEEPFKDLIRTFIQSEIQPQCLHDYINDQTDHTTETAKSESGRIYMPFEEIPDHTTAEPESGQVYRLGEGARL